VYAADTDAIASRSVRKRGYCLQAVLTHYIHAFLLSLTSVVSCDMGISGFLDCWIAGLLDCWIAGLLDCWTDW